MKQILYRVLGLIIATSFISIPALASAETNTTLSSQIQSLMSQIQSLQQQLHTLVQSAASSTGNDGSDDLSGHEWHGGMMGSSTRPKSEDSGHSMGDACPMISRDLHVGLSGHDVSQLQNMLAIHGLLSASSTTGFFGPATAHALGQFQKEFGISASSSTGFLGGLTRAFLRDHCNQKGKSDMQGGQMDSMMHRGTDDHEGSSTTHDMHDQKPPMWQQGSTTPPCDRRFMGGSDSSGSATVRADDQTMHPCRPMMPPPWISGSSTEGWRGHDASSTPGMQPPCAQGEQSRLDNPAAVGAAFFALHSPNPAMGRPCSQMFDSGSDSEHSQH